MSKYYYHGLGEAFHYETSLEKALGIFKNGEIQGERIDEHVNNGVNYVSVYKKLPSEEYDKASMYRHAFSTVVENCFCFIISDEIDIIKPVRIPIYSCNEEEIKKIRELHQNRKFTEMCDEWHVRDSIPLSSVIGIGIPLRWIMLHWKNVNQLEKLGELVTMAEKLGLDIVDTNNPRFVEEYETKQMGESSKVYFVSKAEEGK